MLAVVYQYQRVPPMPPGRLAAPLVSMVFTEPPPPEPSIRRMIGRRKSCAISSAISGLAEIEASAEPPRTVKSSPTTTTVRPSILPRPNTQLAGVKCCEFAVLVIFGDAGNRADLVEAFLIDQPVDALANGEPALVALPLDLVNASHLARERFAPGEVVELRLPIHSCPPP